MAILQLEHLTKRFGNFTAVEDVSLTVADGEMVALLGESGCGKTTTLRMIAGFSEADVGMVSIDGRVMNSIPAYKRNVGIFFQNYALFPHLTAYDNIAFGLKVQKRNRCEISEKVENIIHMVKLDSLEKRYPRELSGGQQQRVALARALVMEPSVMLLDEPLSNLDAKLRIEMQEEIKRIQRVLGITTIIVTHDQEEAISLAHRVVVMDKGRIVQEGPPEEVFERPCTAFIADFMGFVNFFKGKIEAVSTDVVSVRCGDNLIKANASFCGEVSVGDTVKLAIRPEKLQFSADKDSSNAFKGTIESTTYKGNVTRVEISGIFAEPLFAHTSDFHKVPGDMIDVYLPPDKIRVFTTK
ncbi:MAG: ABC transporter ATP-binding protein [Sphaerochaetaceae bacterium]|nr:ABC transporter ATP-binding protein [Sphaerochaetaceae bacterium]